jgi:hypothetical protein
VVQIGGKRLIRGANGSELLDFTQEDPFESNPLSVKQEMHAELFSLD